MGSRPGPGPPGVDVDVRAVADAIHRAGGRDPVGWILGRLRDRRGAVAAALGGEGLQVELALLARTGEQLATHLVLFGPDGVVERLRPGGTLASSFGPQMTLRGECADVVALVLGHVDPARAVQRGLLDLHVVPNELVPRYARLMRVLALHLLGLANQPGGPLSPKAF